MKNYSHRGFTLLELMIVVAVIGILAAIAYPSYTDSILKGRRAEGRAALADLLQQQERYMTQRNTYLAFTSNSSGTPTPSNAPFKTWSGDGTAVGNSAYLLSAEVCPGLSIADCVRIIATPIKPDSQAGDLRMTSTGTKDCTGTNTDLCWR